MVTSTEVINLAESGDIDGLIRLLDNRDNEIWIEALDALNEIGDSRAVVPLIVALRDNDEYFRENVVRVLGNLGDSNAYESLIMALNDDDEGVREAATEALAGIGDKRAVNSLITSLEDQDEYVRKGSAFALGVIGDLRAIQPLENAGFLIEALWLKKDTNGLIRMMKDDDYSNRIRVAQALGYLNDKAAEESLINFLNDIIPEYVRHSAISALAKMGSVHAVKPLFDELNHNQDSNRINAAYYLGEIGDTQSLEPLIKALADDNWSVKNKAKKAILKFGVSAIPYLIKEIKKGNTNAIQTLNELPTMAVGAEYERMELYDDANEWYIKHGLMEAAATIRRKKAELSATKVTQKVVQGDEITSIQDSVVSRSTIGSGGGSLMDELERLGAMKEKGLLSDEEFKAAKEKLLKE